MKILAIHGVGAGKPEKDPPVHLWRIYRPLEELKKHVDWQIDYQKTFIPNADKLKSDKDLTNELIESAGKQLGQYDIIFSSYHFDAAADALIEAVCAKYGTRYVLDDDDNSFAIEQENPYWSTMTHDKTFILQQIVRYAKYVTTTTETLCKVIAERTKVNGEVFVLPNYISEDYKEYDPDNGDKVVIGYFGGYNHYFDLHDTGFMEAVERVMHEHKNVRFKVVGIPLGKYTPKARTEVINPTGGRKWTSELFPTLNFDISCAPLRANAFTRCKSNIKWQESTRMGAAFICSDIPPYDTLPDGTAVKVNNTTEDWYKALKKLVEDATERKRLVSAARKELAANWTLEKNWHKYKEMFEAVKGA